MRRSLLLFCLVLLAASQTVLAATPASRAFNEALDLIHAYGGSGNELQRAMQLADALAKSHPRSGYAQVLRAEVLSTWHLSQQGRPVELRDQIIAMCDEALAFNLNLPQAHVAKARALLRSSMYGEANAAIDAALDLDPEYSGAIFLRAEVLRRTGKIAEADKWYRRFIDGASTRARKSNGYFWLGWMYQDASWDDLKNRAHYIFQAQVAYRSMILENPRSAWAHVNFAGFLNDLAADFKIAERHAEKALSIMDFPMARYQLAAARYQQLAAKATPAQGPELAKTIDGIAASTGVSLPEAIAFRSFSSVVRQRLIGLQACLPPARK